jgi:preprotein translocase subunit SecD
MAKVVNLLILLLVFVFDPLAVALVLMTNRIFELERKDEPQVVENKPIIVNKQPTPEPVTQVVEQKEIVQEEPLMMDEQHEDEEIILEKNDVIKEEIKEETKEEIVETPINNDDVSKIKREDIKEIRNRGFSVNVPNPNSNIVERIGSNKVIRNNDNNTVYYKKNK